MLYTYGFCFFQRENSENLADQNLQRFWGLSADTIVYDLKGVISQPLMAIVSEKINVSELTQLPESELLAKVLEHDRIICEVFRYCPILPLRFGTVFPARLELQAYLQKYQDILLQKLTFLTNKAEYSLEFMPKPVSFETVSKADGKSYLLAKKHQYLEHQKWHDRLRYGQNLWQIHLEQYCQNQPSLYPILHSPTLEKTDKYYLLLTSQQRSELESLLQKNVELWQEWQWQWGEPLPPYHFAELD